MYAELAIGMEEARARVPRGTKRTNPPLEVHAGQAIEMEYAHSQGPLETRETIPDGSVWEVWGRATRCIEAGSEWMELDAMDSGPRDFPAERRRKRET